MVLHILLVILKIAGIILAVILGILVLLLCAVLFVPVRYRIKGGGDGSFDTIYMNGNVTWFFRLLSGSFCYENGKTNVHIRIFFRTVSKKQKADNEREKQKKPEPERKKERKAEKKVEKKEETKPAEETTGTEKNTVQNTKRKEQKQKLSFFQRIIQKIKYTIRKICDTIKKIIEKKEKVISFIEDEIHRNAFVKMKQELFRLIRILRPKKIKAALRFGFEDPYLTGKALAFLGMIYPFLGDNTDIIPDFEKKILKGNFDMQGHIRSVTFAALAIRLFINKEIRTTYNHIRQFKF